MNEQDYGHRISQAVRAVARMHGDTSKLLIDCDKRIGGGRTSVFGSYATRDLTYNVQAPFWMAEGVYRYWLVNSNCVDAVTVSFLDDSPDDDPSSEPLFLLAKIEYASDNALAEIKTLCQEWDVWRLYFEWGERKPGGILEYENVDGGRIKSARLIAVPLYSIDSIDRVLMLQESLTSGAG